MCVYVYMNILYVYVCAVRYVHTCIHIYIYICILCIYMYIHMQRKPRLGDLDARVLANKGGLCGFAWFSISVIGDSKWTYEVN